MVTVNDKMERDMLPKTWESFLISSEYIPVILKSIDIFYNTNRNVEQSKHDSYEMVYVKKGNASFDIAGNKINIGPNDIIIIKPGQQHSFHAMSQGGCEVFVLNFNFEKYEKQKADAGLKTQPDTVLKTQPDTGLKTQSTFHSQTIPDTHNQFQLDSMKQSQTDSGLKTHTTDNHLKSPLFHTTSFVKYTDSADSEHTNGHSEVSLDDFLNFASHFGKGAFLQLKVAHKNEIISILGRIQKEREGGEPGSDFLCRLLVLELFVLLSRALKLAWEDDIKIRSNKLKELVQISERFIKNNFERDISLSDISKYVFLSPGYFARAFKDETGISPISYLLRLRVERAKELLGETDKKITDIALGVGFSSQQRFNAIFKKHTGMAPYEYRKSIKSRFINN